MADDLMEREMMMKSKLYVTTNTLLKETMIENSIEAEPGNMDTRVKAIQLIEKWFNGQKEAGNTEVSLLHLEHSLGIDVQEVGTGSKVEAEEESMKPEEHKPKGPSHVSLRKEFKIYGQIDSVKGLAFVSLIRQIENGLKKGYQTLDIIDAIIRAVPSGRGLRNYLEGRPDLSLPSLRKILRAHYKERSPTELFNQMSQLTQGLKEEPSDFLIRALELRQKILFASLEEKSELKYNEKLVDNMFSRTVYTGLGNDTIRHEMKRFLDQEGIDEERLIEHMSLISLREEERSSKFGKNACRKVQVNNIETEVEGFESHEKKKKKAPAEGKLNVEVNALRAEVNALKEMMTNQFQPRTNAPRNMPVRIRRKCEECEKEQKQDCYHCWRCGSDEHFAKGCRKQANKVRAESRQNSQGNSTGFMRGDRH